MTPRILAILLSLKVFKKWKTHHDHLVTSDLHITSLSKHLNTCETLEARSLQVKRPSNPWLRFLPSNGFRKLCASCVHGPLHWQQWASVRFWAACPETYLNREHQLGKIPDHSCVHIVRSAATSWGPDRGHNAPEIESRSGSLGGNELQPRTKERRI